MASVRMNQRIRNHALQRIRQQSNQRLEKAEQRRPDKLLATMIDTLERPEVMDKMEEAYQAQKPTGLTTATHSDEPRNLLSVCYLGNRYTPLEAVNTIRVRVDTTAWEIIKQSTELLELYSARYRNTFGKGSPDQDIKTAAKSEKISQWVEISVKRAFYIGVSNMYRSRDFELIVRIPREDTDTLPDVVRDFQDAYMLYAKKRYRVQIESNMLEQSVRKILHDCSTLRQVLKLWPNALDYMPPDVVNQHHAKSEKRSGPRDLSDLELGESEKTVLAKTRIMNL